MIVLMWFLNFGISWLNAWGCGKTWNETKHTGGFPHFMNWMGATMSACGFTWCYMVIVVTLGSTIQVNGENGLPPHALLSPEIARAVADLAYLAIIGPVLGSGLAITLHAWGVAYRRRSFGAGAVAAYDTWAMIYNVRSAVQYVPEALSGLSDIFESKDSDDKGKVVIALAAATLAGGVLTTRAIIRSTAKSTARERSLYEPGS